MNERSQTTFQWENGKKFSIYYSKDGSFKPNRSIIGQAYPNPFNSRITIPLLASDQDQSFHFQVIDASGKEIANIQKSINKVGQDVLEWDGKDASGNEVMNGLYFFRMSLNGEEKVMRVIKNKTN